jgi:hypothetical protein
LSQSGGDGGAYFIEDETSFAGPRRQAIADCVEAFKRASTPVMGAEARLHAALTDLKAMNQFVAEVDRLIENQAFQTLPGFKRGRERFDGYHQLTVGPWRGVFLVSRDGSNVVALLFSRHPHALEARLRELSEPYMRDTNQRDAIDD